MTPRDYIRHVIQIIETNAYFQPDVADWDAVKTEAVRSGDDAKTFADCHPIVRTMIKALNDHHSHLITPISKTNQPSQVEKSGVPQGWPLERWGYITLPPSAGDDVMQQQYAEAGQKLIRNMHACDGWIVDLRDNSGGNMWSMLIAIGAIAGEGTLGFFIDRDKTKIPWGYKAGASVYDSETVYSVEDPVALIPDDRPVAVLIGNNTQSSGEITMLSLMGRLNIRTFGQSTRGIPTANDTYPLEDGAILVLTTALCADRNGRVYETSIPPDVICDDPLDQAKLWLANLRAS